MHVQGKPNNSSQFSELFSENKITGKQAGAAVFLPQTAHRVDIELNACVSVSLPVLICIVRVSVYPCIRHSISVIRVSICVVCVVCVSLSLSV